MPLIALHSAQYAKIFRGLLGMSCGLVWRESGEKHRLWVTAPGHPIVEGLGQYFEIPQPDELVFIGWSQGGNVFGCECCFHRGRGKIFYFQPEHEMFSVFYQPEIVQVIGNAARWAAPIPVVSFRRMAADMSGSPHAPDPLDPIPDQE